MKNYIKSAALFLLASVGVFAANTSKAAGVPVKDLITFSELPADRGIDVKIDPSLSGTAVVTIYNENGDVLRKDLLNDKKGTEKAYVLNQLEDGDYTISVYANGQTVTKDIHVYEEVQEKQFIIVE